MKKSFRILVPLLALLVAVFAFGGVALADDPTTTTITWNGGGSVDSHVDNGDSNAGFNAVGNLISGSFSVVDSNNNPYSYSVDSFSAYFTGSVTDGWMAAGVMRVNSYSPMYGNGGQWDFSAVNVAGGTGSMAFRSTTNYAQLVNASYTYQLPGGHNIVVDALAYQINRYIGDGRGNSGELIATGDGTATLDCMSSEASGAWNLKLGAGAGCYTDASFVAVGNAGHFQVTGTGVDSVVFNGLGLSSGGGSLSVVANWVNNFNIADYSLTAH